MSERSYHGAASHSITAFDTYQSCCTGLDGKYMRKYNTNEDTNDIDTLRNTPQ